MAETRSEFDHPDAADETVFNVAFKMRHCNGKSTLEDHMAFLYPPGYGEGVGTLEQQRHGWISFQIPVAGTDRWAAARIASDMARTLKDTWTLEPYLPHEAKMTELHLDPGFGDETFPWESTRLISCNVCHTAASADTADEGRTWMLAHPDDHTPEQRAKLGDSVHHYTLRAPAP